MTTTRKRPRMWRPPAAVVCGPSKDYAHGDPPPPKARGYSDFIAWYVAQLKRRKRPKATR